MATDFRANQVRLNRLISSGSTPILVYPSSSASDLTGGQTAEFVTSSVGTDVFFFVSGATDGTGKSLFGGDAVVSGNVRIDQSLAQGNSVVASGLYSHAQGFGTNATNFYTHAEGISTTASGFYAHAEGNLTTASGIAAHGEGLGSQASGNYSHAEGDSATSSGEYSHAEGSGSIASGKYSHAEGDLTTASGMYSHTEGTGVSANGTASHAEGTFTVANGDYSHAEGSGATTYGSSSHAEGFAGASYGDFSHAEGAFCNANGLYSHAEGYFTLAHGEASHAEGFGSETVGTGSFAAGLYTVASGSVDGVFPPPTIQAAFGKYNLQGNTDSLFVVGDGLDASNRHDVFRVNSGSVQVTGSFIAPNITGSIEYVDDVGTIPFLINGPNITTNYNSLGQWEITGSGGGGTNYFSEVALNSIATTGSVAMTYLSSSSGAEITGSFRVLGDITGSISGTISGNSFIAAGPNITTNYNSYGQWEITGSAFTASEVVALTQASNILLDTGSLAYIVIDPSGTPASRKTTLARLGLPPKYVADQILELATPVINVANQSTGQYFLANRTNQTCTGVRVYWAGTSAVTLSLSLWQDGVPGAPLASASVITTTTAGFYSASFAAAINLSRSLAYIATCYETTGNSAMAPPSMALGGYFHLNPTYGGYLFMDYNMITWAFTAAGNALPGTINGGSLFPIDPLISG
jgi:hypothetical protein